MFTTPCFIKRISSELKEKLKELGYRDVGKARYYGESQYIYCEGGIFYESPCMIKARYNTFIDCGDNEELFLALAALRDDTDINQWFIYNSMDCIIEKLRTIDWFICDENSIEDFAFYDSLYLLCHKATVEELIEHFKEK